MRFSREQVWERTAVILATGLGVGHSRVAPGTVGSLWGLALVWLLHRLELPVVAELSIAFGIVLAGIPICSRAARSLKRRDPRQVVFDEIAALPFVFLSVQLNFTTTLVGFGWFRLFDVTKPWPIGWLEKLPGGVGIMADDLAAGLYAAAALWFTVRLAGWA